MAIEPKLPPLDDEEPDVTVEAPLDESADTSTDTPVDTTDDSTDESSTAATPPKYLAKLLEQKQAQRTDLGKLVDKDNLTANAGPAKLSREQLIAGSLIPLLTMGAGFALKGKTGLNAGGDAAAGASKDYFNAQQKVADSDRAQAKSDLALHTSEAKSKDAEIGRLELEGVRGQAKDDSDKAKATAKNPSYEGSEYDDKKNELIQMGSKPEVAGRAAKKESSYQAELKAQKELRGVQTQNRADDKENQQKIGTAKKENQKYIDGYDYIDGTSISDSDVSKARKDVKDKVSADVVMGNLQEAMQKVHDATVSGDRDAKSQALAEAQQSYKSAILGLKNYEGLSSRLTQYGIGIEKGILPALMAGPDTFDAQTIYRKLGATYRHEDPVALIQRFRNEMNEVENAKLKSAYNMVPVEDAGAMYDKRSGNMKSTYGFDDNTMKSILGDRPKAKPLTTEQLIQLRKSDPKKAYDYWEKNIYSSGASNGQ